MGRFGGVRCLNCGKDGLPLKAEVCPQCGVYLPSLLRDVLPAGTTLAGKYQITYALGRGGFGITYQAIHSFLEQMVAVKEFFPQTVVRQGTTAEIVVPTTEREAYDRGLRRFRREGQTLAKMDHPNVVGVRDYFEERGTAYLVMEYVEGVTLRKMMEAQPEQRFTPTRVREIMGALVNALNAVHAAGIYHLDLKPDNVLLTPEGRLVLVDFGAARQGFGGNKKSSTQAFTEAYAPPEILGRRDVGPESDIFEMGMMLYEMLTGELPPSVLLRTMDDTWQPEELADPWKGLVVSALPLDRKKRPHDIKQWWETRIGIEGTQQQVSSRPLQEARIDNQQVQQVGSRPLQEARIDNQQAPQGDSQLPLQQEAPQPLFDRVNSPEIDRPSSAESGVETPGKPIKYGRWAAILAPAVLAFLALNVFPRIGEVLENPDRALPQVERCINLAKNGQHQEALPICDRAVEVNPNNALAWFGRGFALAKLERHQDAIESYDRAIELESDNANIWDNRGFSLAQLGQHKKAIESYNRAVELNPDFARAWHNRGFSLAETKQHQEALKSFDRAIELDPDNAMTWSRRGTSLGSLGRHKDAVESYDRALTLDPDNALAWLGRGTSLAALDRHKDAVESYDRATELVPDNFLVWFGRGASLTLLKRHEEAIESYDRALKLKSDLAIAWLGRGVSLTGLRRCEEAIRSFNRALEIDPNLEQAKSIRDRVRRTSCR